MNELPCLQKLPLEIVDNIITFFDIDTRILQKITPGLLPKISLPITKPEVIDTDDVLSSFISTQSICYNYITQQTTIFIKHDDIMMAHCFDKSTKLLFSCKSPYHE